MSAGYVWASAAWLNLKVRGVNDLLVNLSSSGANQMPTGPGRVLLESSRWGIGQ